MDQLTFEFWRLLRMLLVTKSYMSSREKMMCDVRQIS
jgi:hypothetical protein